MKKIFVIGSGPYSIGSSVEFDWCSVQVLRTLRQEGFETIFINSNPETVSTDFDECDRLYFEEITVEKVLDIYQKEKPDGIIFSTGGQVAQNIAINLKNHNLPFLGTDIQSIDRCENRCEFSKLCDDIEVAQPEWDSFSELKSAYAFADKVGYPVLVRPSFVLSGAAMAVATDEVGLKGFLEKAVDIYKDNAIVISKFEENSKEIEFDGVAQNGEIIVSAISEHIENAGVHSGDATIVLPPKNIYIETFIRIRKTTEKLVKKLNISGPFNIQFLARKNDIKIIECNLRASRSFPFASKVLQQNFIKIATQIWIGKTLNPQEKDLSTIDYVGIKAAQFSFSRLKDADPNLCVEMSATGEVACFGKTEEEAFLKSLLSVGFTLPEPGSAILVTIGKIQDKVQFLNSAEKFIELGYSFLGTSGTAQFLKENGIPCETVYKISSKKHPNVLDTLEDKKVGLVINTPTKFSHEEKSDGYLIRRKAIDRNIPLIINLQLVQMLARGLDKFPTLRDLVKTV